MSISKEERSKRIAERKEGIKNLRIELELTQEEFARQFDVSARSVSRWENPAVDALPNTSLWRRMLERLPRVEVPTKVQQQGRQKMTFAKFTLLFNDPKTDKGLLYINPSQVTRVHAINDDFKHNYIEGVQTIVYVVGMEQGNGVEEDLPTVIAELERCSR